MDGPVEFVGGAIKGIGDFGGGVLKHLGTGLTAVRDAERAKLALPELQRKKLLQQLNIDEEKLNAFLNNQKVMNAFREAQTKALGEGRTIYGGRGRGTTATDPIKRAGEVGVAIERMDVAGMFDDNEELKDTLTAYAIKDLPGIKEKEEAGRKEKEKYQKILEDTADMISPEFGKDIRAFFSEGVSPFETTEPAKKTPSLSKGKLPTMTLDTIEQKIHQEGRDQLTPEEEIFYRENAARSLGEYFQGATETIPEENIPKTFEQLGITDAADQATLQEMQEIVPDVDLRQEYEDDPEGMKQLIELWRKGKLNKKNIRNAFSKLQQRARTALGIA